MNEHEKMLKGGLLYDPFSENMDKERENAHRLCKIYNETFETDVKKRQRILDKLIPNKGKNIYLQGPIFFDFGVNTYVGNNFYANFNFTVLDEGKVCIGDNVFIGPNVSLLTAVHPLRYQDRNSFFNEKTGVITNLEYTLPITIEDNCWIAANVVVCGGVTVGAGAVVGAGSVVTKNIPPNSLAVGNPCRVVREITEKDNISNLLKYKL